MLRVLCVYCEWTTDVFEAIFMAIFVVRTTWMANVILGAYR
jgi:hypothetical protein